MAFCKLFCVLVLIHNAGDLLGAEVKSGIVGGENAAKGQWPWMVHLNISDGVNKWRCGGTILNERWLLTAAHCFDPPDKPYYLRSMVWVGSHELKKGAVRYVGINSVVNHKEYKKQSNGYVNDIALVWMKKALKMSNDVKAVTLPSVDDTFSSSSECWIIGWGNTATDVPLRDPEPLQQLKVNIVSQTECKNQYPDLNSNMLCAGGTGKDACKGDYGGPLVCRIAGSFVQVGIMSYGSPDGCGVAPGVYTQVSKYLEFINGQIHHGNEASADV